ncbi:MAG: hypothetical protein JNG88_04990 [Phycisphaerales bacterium]|nr:hypothetical protein [Phycisphaerales bacterium]
MVHTRDMRELLSPGGGGFQIVEDPSAPDYADERGTGCADNDGGDDQLGPRAGEEEEEVGGEEEGDDFEFDEFDEAEDDDVEEDDEEEFDEEEDDLDEFGDDDDDDDEDDEE